MGATLAKVVLGPTWAHLGDSARVLLAHMAVTARDQDETPRYYGGRDELVKCLYGKVSEDPRERAMQYRVVRRLLATIEKAGGIGSRTTGRKGVTPAEYQLNLYPGLEASQQAPNTQKLEDRSGPPITGDWRTAGDTLEDRSGPIGGPQRSPTGTIRNKKEQGGAPPRHRKAGAAAPPANGNSHGTLDEFRDIWPSSSKPHPTVKLKEAWNEALRYTDEATLLDAAATYAAVIAEDPALGVDDPVDWLERNLWTYSIGEELADALGYCDECNRFQSHTRRCSENPHFDEHGRPKAS